jgi:hypothetical protein
VTVNPPPGTEDEFDRSDEPTNVDSPTVEAQIELNRSAIIELTPRVTTLEKGVEQLGGLVRQIIERFENLTNQLRKR